MQPTESPDRGPSNGSNQRTDPHYDQGSVPPVVTTAPVAAADLFGLSVSELIERYQRAAAPNLETMVGQAKGHVFAVAGPVGRSFVGAALIRWARSPGFPWQGKHFTAPGHGTNRIQLAGERQVCPFHTDVVPSAIDGQPCLALDYAVTGNPWPIRAVHDELREAREGLYFGPMYLKVKGAPKHLLMFWGAELHLQE